ncbi:bacteriohemerythrin [Sunxiuqinia elliptica]|uniref:Hemerythrin n=1 Tax=Sunxiuqinia elliptica TaxID=655355 RepID=A0A1I2G0D6_9BACT|nr:hemerythrin family protein [Sunxiuqinia elliptica]SFF10569.1 hemerythrin [Sunxiuqinia elliptica]
MDKQFSWKKKYEIGIPEIDSEHQIFLKTIQKLFEAYQKEEDKGILSGLFLELYKYADFHFISEENIMLINGYPEYAVHKKEHHNLLQKLAGIINTFDTKYIDKDQLFEFLLEWFTIHTTNSDRKLGAYLGTIK